MIQTSRCVGDSAEQPEGAGATEPSVHHSGHRHSERDLLALHSFACPHERVQSAGAECAERSPQVPLLHVRVHRGNGQGLYLRRYSAAGGRTHGTVC